MVEFGRLRLLAVLPHYAHPFSTDQFTQAQLLPIHWVIRHEDCTFRQAGGWASTVQEMMSNLHFYLRIMQARPQLVTNYSCERHVQYGAN